MRLKRKTRVVKMKEEKVVMRYFGLTAWRVSALAASVILLASLAGTSRAQTIQEFPTPTRLLPNPWGIAAGPGGAIWFTEEGAGKIGQVTTSGAFTEYRCSPCAVPAGIAVGSDGALWFTGEIIGRITTSGSINTFTLPLATAVPSGIAAGPDGALWFAEAGTGKIGKITTSGTITEFPTSINHSEPISITAGPDGAMWFTDYGAEAIGRITTAGVITEFPTSFFPINITAGPDGALWFTYGGIGRITTAGQITYFPSPVSQSAGFGITLGPDGALWFPDQLTNSIGRMTTSGTVTEIPIPTANSLSGEGGNGTYPNQITTGPDGAIWFTETAAGQIGRLSLGPTSGPSPLVAAVLPSSRSVQIGNTATAFATIINSGSSAVSGCAIVPVTTVPASFVYQTTNPATNALTGSPNTPASIAAGGSQSFVIAFTPTAPFVPTNVVLGFSCTGVSAAPSTTGLNTLLLSASTTPVPDIVALAATALNDGILHIIGTSGSGAFAVATVNVGASAQITATANTGSRSLPLTINLCQTDPMSGQCITSVGPTATFTINASATPTVAIFATASGTVPFDPANNRIFVTFSDAGSTVRGSTSVAVQTQ